jgi:hypothetical protein
MVAMTTLLLAVLRRLFRAATAERGSQSISAP